MSADSVTKPNRRAILGGAAAALGVAALPAVRARKFYRNGTRRVRAQQHLQLSYAGLAALFQ